LLLSFAAHGALLKLPFPKSDPPTPEVAEEPPANLQVVALPDDPTAIQTTSAPVESPPPEPPRSEPPAARPEVRPDRVAEVQPEPPEVSPTEVSQTEVSQTTEPPASTQPPDRRDGPPLEPEEGPTLPPPPEDNPFPHPEGAIAGGCGQGDCYTITGSASYRYVAQQLQDRLTRQGYTVTSLNNRYDEPGREVYELTNAAGETQYLLVFSRGPQEAVYVVMDRVVTWEELGTA
jgi:hypothetical protein